MTVTNSKYRVNRDLAAKLLLSVDLHMFSLLTLLSLTFGDEFYEEDPLETFLDLKDYYGVYPSEQNQNKINLFIVGVSTPLFFDDLLVFKSIVKTFLTGYPDDNLDSSFSDETYTPTLLDIKATKYELELIIGNEIEFSLDILGFIHSKAIERTEDNEGYYSPMNEVLDIFLKAMKSEIVKELDEIGVYDLKELLIQYERKSSGAIQRVETEEEVVDRNT